MQTAHVREHRDALRRPERRVLGERLGTKHVEHGARDAPDAHGLDEILVDDQIAAREVQQKRRRLHEREPSSIHEPPGLRGRG